MMPLEMSVLEASAPVTSRSYRINPTFAQDVDTSLDHCLAAGLI